MSVARLSKETCGAVAKASPNRALPSGTSLGFDPKPGELPMARVKPR